MWKLFKRLKEGVGTGSERGSVASGSSSVADLRGKFILEKVRRWGLGAGCFIQPWVVSWQQHLYLTSYAHQGPRTRVHSTGIR